MKVKFELTAVEPVHTADVAPRDGRVSQELVWVALRDDSWAAVPGVGVPGHPQSPGLVPWLQAMQQNAVCGDFHPEAQLIWGLAHTYFP